MKIEENDTEDTVRDAYIDTMIERELELNNPDFVASMLESEPDESTLA